MLSWNITTNKPNQIIMRINKDMTKISILSMKNLNYVIILKQLIIAFLSEIKPTSVFNDYSIILTNITVNVERYSKLHINLYYVYKQR